MNTLLHRYFSFDGRLARLRFFARNFALGVGPGVLFIASLPLFATDTQLGFWAGVLVVIAGFAVFAVGVASLTVRRLHDLGLSGYHAIWAVAAQAGLVVLPYAPPAKSLFALPLAAAWLWVSFWPGSRTANRFGDVPE
jgi:uncharacterized membrane protein YhaH (DUF805 family)